MISIVIPIHNEEPAILPSVRPSHHGSGGNEQALRDSFRG